MSVLSKFLQPYKWQNEQGSAAAPKEITLVVIAWEPQGYGDLPLSLGEIEQLFFGAKDSVADWIERASHGRYKIKPHPTQSVLGPYQSKYWWPFYWRNSTRKFYDPETGTWSPTYSDPDTGAVEVNYVMNRLTLAEWQANPYKVPPSVGSGKLYIHPENGLAYYLDDDGFIGGHNHSWAEAVTAAAEDIDFSLLKTNPGDVLTLDEAAVVVVKAQTTPGGTSRPATGKDVPKESLKANGVEIPEVCELYAGTPATNQHLAVAIEEVIHLILRYADEYPDGTYRTQIDTRRPGQLSLSDAGYRPVNVGSYFRLKWGWTNAQVADVDSTYKINSIENGDDVLIVPSKMPTPHNEYFLIENRWRGGSYDQYRDPVWGEGLAIWHIIEDPSFDGNVWARRAVELRRANPNLSANSPASEASALFRGPSGAELAWGI